MCLKWFFDGFEWCLEWLLGGFSGIFLFFWGGVLVGFSCVVGGFDVIFFVYRVSRFS